MGGLRGENDDVMMVKALKYNMKKENVFSLF
jgi:hypothetical protein